MARRLAIWRKECFFDLVKNSPWFQRILLVTKLVAGNILIFLFLLFVVNLGVITLFQVKGLLSRSSSNERIDQRHKLPVYDNLEWAETHFNEFEALATEYRSYVGWRRLPVVGETITIDEEGIRKTLQHEAVSADAPLVAFLGGSTMWGTGSTDAGTIPSLFAEKSGGDYRAVNYGESAYNAYQGFLFLHGKLIQGIRPDFVISYDGVNNLYFPGRKLLMNGREDQIRKSLKGADRWDPDFGSEHLSFSNFLLKPIQVFVNRVIRKTSPLESAGDVETKAVRMQSAVFELLESWLATKHLCEQYKAEFLAVLQPNALSGNPDVSYLDLRATENWWKYYQFVPSKIQSSERYRELRPHFIDLSDAFDAGARVYVDYCHVTPEGNNIIAGLLLERLRVGAHGGEN